MSTSSGDPAGRGSLHQWLLWFTGVAAAVAVIVLAAFAWIEASKSPEIVFIATPQSLVMVDARGAISTPGVVTLKPGARVIDVIDTAGGLTDDADLSLINRAARVYDGQILVFPTVPTSSGSTDAGLLNINTATVAQLEQLPGIGEVIATRIVAYRDANGPFQTVDDLLQVEGVSEGLLEDIRPFITVSDGG